MQVKGTAIIVLPKFIEARFGPGRLAEWQNALAPQAQQVYRDNIFVNEWYPLREIFLEPTVKLCELFFDGDHKGAWELGRFSADYALRGVCRSFVKLTSVQFFIRRASAMMATYYQPSSIEAVNVDSKHALLRITQFPDISDVVEQRIAGWVHRALEINGCQEVKVQITQSLTRGDPCTEISASWK